MKRALLLAIALATCGCASWRPIGLTPEAVLAREDPQVLWITGGPAGTIQLREPRVEGDSLVGTVEGRRTAIALRDVTYVGVRRCDQTAARVFVPILLAFGVLVAAFASDPL